MVLAAAVAAVIIVRLQAAPVPLERDEGEYALMGQLMLDGVPPYSEAANMKLPGIYYAYSAILALFGQTVVGIHMGLLVVNLFSTIIVYLIARRLFGAAGAALSGAAFIITSADNSVLGLFAHATQFVVLFALAGTWLLQKGLESSLPPSVKGGPLPRTYPQGEGKRCGSKRRGLLLWGSGVCMGLALLMKQSGVFFALFGFVWVVYATFRSRPVVWKRFLFDAGSLAAGIALPLAVILMLMARQGVLDRFWFWTIEYARAYASEVDLKGGLELFQLGIGPIIKNNPVIWSMTIAGMIGVWFTESGRNAALFLLLFLLFSFLSVCPGFFFRQHYFVQLLPAAALYAGAAVFALEKAAAKYTARSKALEFVILFAVTAVSLTSVFSVERVLATSTPDRFSRSVYGANPFPESGKDRRIYQEKHQTGRSYSDPRV